MLQTSIFFNHFSILSSFSVIFMFMKAGIRIEIYNYVSSTSTAYALKDGMAKERTDQRARRRPFAGAANVGL